MRTMVDGKGNINEINFQIHFNSNLINMIKTGFRLSMLILMSAYCIIYFIGFVFPFFIGEMSLSNPLDLSVLLMFLFFLTGLVFAWFNGFIGGLILMLWHLSIWIIGLYYWPDAGMVIILSFPVLILGSLLLLEYHRSKKAIRLPVSEQRKYILRVLSLNYTAIYLLNVIAAYSESEIPNYWDMPYILFPLLLVMYLLGFALSWKNEFFTGLVFIAWYALVVVGTTFYPEFSNKGPFVLIGVTILIQGILYVINHYQFKKENIPV